MLVASWHDFLSEPNHYL